MGVLALVLCLGCSGGSESASPAEESAGPAGTVAPQAVPPQIPSLNVYTVNYPLAYFAERIGGDLVEVSFPAPPDADPALWSPDAEAVAAYQSADLILMNGADYAKWAARVSLPSSKMVDTSAALADRLVPLEHNVTHTHGPGGEHSHTGWAATMWLDPVMALEMAIAVRDAMVTARPEGGAAFAAGFDALAADLQALDGELEASVATLSGRPILVSHPVYQYLIARHQLEARALDWEPGEAPDEEAWRKLDATLAHHPAEVILWESEPLPETRRRLEELGLTVLVYELAANRPATGDWLSVMRANRARLDGLAAGP